MSDNLSFLLGIYCICNSFQSLYSFVTHIFINLIAEMPIMVRYRTMESGAKGKAPFGYFYSEYQDRLSGNTKPNPHEVAKRVKGRR